MKILEITMIFSLGAAVGCTGSSGAPTDMSGAIQKADDFAQVETAEQVAPNVSILPVHGKHYGKTYGEWGAAWWQWAFSMPSAANVVIDTTTDCTTAQPGGPVFFLAGMAASGALNGHTTRACTIPPGKALFVPLLNAYSDILPPADGTTEEQLHEVAHSFNFPVNELAADVDGVPIRRQVLDRHYEVSPLFLFTLPEGNIFQLWGYKPPAAAGTYAAVDEGWYLLFEPLPRGPHTIHFKSNWNDTFIEDVTYNLTIQ